MFDYDDDNNPRRGGYFGPLFRWRTYTNLIYVLLAFPLGMLYFTVLIAGFSMGLALLVLLVGIPILAGVMWLSGIGAAFERMLANVLLETNMPVLPRQDRQYSGFLQLIIGEVTRISNIKSVIYLFSKFFFGIFCLLLTIFTLGLPVMIVLAPFTATDESLVINDVPSLIAALILAGIGIVLIPLGLRFNNAVMALWKRYTTLMLYERPADVEKRKNKAKRGYVEVPAYADADVDKPKRRLSDDESVGEDDYFTTPARSPDLPKTLAELLENRRDIDYE